MTTGFLRCPHCSSAIRPGAAWCSLCHADLRSDEERAAAEPAPVEVAEELERDDELERDEELETSPARVGGRHARRGSAGPADAVAMSAEPDPLAEVDVESMLAALGGQDPLAGVAGRFSSKANIAMFAFGGAALLTVLGLLAMFVLGSFLH